MNIYILFPILRLAIEYFKFPPNFKFGSDFHSHRCPSSVLFVFVPLIQSNELNHDFIYWKIWVFQIPKLDNYLNNSLIIQNQTMSAFVPP